MEQKRQPIIIPPMSKLPQTPRLTDTQQQHRTYLAFVTTRHQIAQQGLLQETVQSTSDAVNAPDVQPPITSPITLHSSLAQVTPYQEFINIPISLTQNYIPRKSRRREVSNKEALFGCATLLILGILIFVLLCYLSAAS